MPTKASNSRLPTGEVLSTDYDQEPDGTLAQRDRVEPLGVPSVARSLAAGATSANVALTAACTRVSMLAVGADICFNLNSAATTSSHYVASGERVDIRVQPGTTVHAIRAGSSDGTLRISELT